MSKFQRRFTSAEKNWRSILKILTLPGVHEFLRRKE
jgi:hypothetical protein